MPELESTVNPQSRRRPIQPRPIRRSVVLIAATILLGIAIRFAPLGLPAGISKYGGSALWALLIYWIVSTVVPRLSPAASIAAIFTAAVEAFKLYHSPGLDAFRRTLPGALLLGRVFSGWDILAHWLAISIGLLIDLRLRARPR